jgi:hypothetical protein
MSRILFTNTMIFEGTGKDLVPGEVLVQGDRIQAVAGPGETMSRNTTWSSSSTPASQPTQQSSN